MVPPDIPSEMSNLLPLIGGLGWFPLTRAGGDDGFACRKTWLSSSAGSFILGMIELLSASLSVSAFSCSQHHSFNQDRV